VKILITGGGGFIGSHLADRLLARGDEVLVLENYATGRRDNLDSPKGLTVQEGTIADADWVGEHFASFRPDVVAHAAASYKDPEDWPEDAATNAVGTANVVKASQDVGVGRLIYFQTALCYGLQPITLDHPLRPGDSSYAISKTAGEHYVALSNLDWVSFRLANAYGPRNVSGPLPTFFQRLTAEKPVFVMDTRRDFIYVQDLIDVVEMAIDGRGTGGAYHVSSGSDFSIKELLDATLAALGKQLDEEVEVRPRGPDDAPTILLDPIRTESEFGWRTSTPLEEGVAAAVDYYREYGVEETFTHLKLAAETEPAQ
jgi:UDP-glucose 4-epimerase